MPSPFGVVRFGSHLLICFSLYIWDTVYSFTSYLTIFCAPALLFSFWILALMRTLEILLSRSSNSTLLYPSYP